MRRDGARRIEGLLDDVDATSTYRRDGRTLAVATLHRDLESLRAELALELAIRAKS